MLAFTPSIIHTQSVGHRLRHATAALFTIHQHESTVPQTGNAGITVILPYAQAAQPNVGLQRRHVRPHWLLTYVDVPRARLVRR